jgi:NADPH2:quinone reductase
VDLAANAKLIPDVLRPRGTVVIYGTGNSSSEIPLTFLLRNAITLKYIYVYELSHDERAAAVAAITRSLEASALINNVGATFPLVDIVAAHEAVEDGKVLDNVVVRVS